MKGKQNMKSTLWVKRVVLVDGRPSGKGRPGKGVQKSRTCLYIPLKETFGNHTKSTSERPYNPGKNQDQRKQFKRTNVSALRIVGGIPTPAVEAPVAVNTIPVEAPAEAPSTPVEISAS